MAHIHEKYVYDNSSPWQYETENFGIKVARVYDPLTRELRPGYVLINKDDGIVQGDSWSLFSVINAMVQSQQGVALAKAWNEQAAQADDTEALITAFDGTGPGGDDVVN